jgi:DinB superfamily
MHFVGGTEQSMSATVRPDRSEAAEYYFTYIDKVHGDDIVQILDAQSAETLSLLGSISDDRSLHRYAPDKWSIREVVGHLNDTERLFVFRAFWFARGFDSPLPSFDQHIAVSTGGANDRTWTSHLDEFRALRAATVAFFRELPADAWSRRGIASDNPFSVRALAFLAAGHVIHHTSILRERYLQESEGVG